MHGRRYVGPATIVHEHGSVEVECELEVVQEGGLTAWRGSYSGAEIAEEPMGGEAELQLDSERTGSIIITTAFLGSGNGWFTGNGDAPRF